MLDADRGPIFGSPPALPVKTVDLLSNKHDRRQDVAEGARCQHEQAPQMLIGNSPIGHHVCAGIGVDQEARRKDEKGSQQARQLSAQQER